MITTEYNIDKQMDQLRKKFETQVKQLSQDFQKEWSSTFKGDFEEDKRRTKKINTTEDFIGIFQLSFSFLFFLCLICLFVFIDYFHVSLIV